MIAELFLGLISLGILGAFCFYVYIDRKEHQKLINAIKSKTAMEQFNLDMTDKLEVGTKPEPEAAPLDFTPTENIPDDEYIQNITSRAPDVESGEDDGQEQE